MEMTIDVRNVNHALASAMLRFETLSAQGDKYLINSRNGPTLEFPCPVVTRYARPRERVVFSAVRDANPFFHFFESLWILAGRKDVTFLAHILPKIEDYSDDHEVFHAPYGYRLRHHFHKDQLNEVVHRLNKDRGTRQAVLQIWDCMTDLNAISMDLPCNDLIFLRVRGDCLDLTVCCRSNDALWGAYGANAVQFSVLQEYLAGRINANVGAMYQVSNSLHVYVNEKTYQRCRSAEPWTVWLTQDPYRQKEVHPYHMMTIPEHFDEDLELLFRQMDFDIEKRQVGIAVHPDDEPQFPVHNTIHNRFISEVAWPLWRTMEAYKDHRRVCPGRGRAVSGG